MIELEKPFHKLPIRFDAETLAQEVRALPEAAWTPHPTGFVGNEAVRQISPGGQDTDAIEGPMAPTLHLLACPYTMETMTALGGVHVGFDAMKLTFAFDAAKLSVVLDAAIALGDETLAEEPPWAVGIAQGDLRPVTESGSALTESGLFWWGPAIVAA